MRAVLIASSTRGPDEYGYFIVKFPDGVDVLEKGYENTKRSGTVAACVRRCIDGQPGEAED